MRFAKGFSGVFAGLVLLLALLPRAAFAITTTTVQGTIFRADGRVAVGTLLLSWPAFTTASNDAVASGNIKVAIGQDGFVNLTLAANEGAYPDGSYYTAVYHLSDGTTSTEYWVVPSASSVAIASIRARIMPAAVATQNVSKLYVDNSLTLATAGFLSMSGGAMVGPLTLSTDPTSVQQAVTKHYVDQSAATLLSKGGGVMTGSLFLSGDPASDLQATTKGYVDQSSAAMVQKGGDSMTGPLVTPMVNGKAFPIGLKLQQAIDAAGPTGSVEIPANYSGSDTFSNPSGIPVTDLRVNSSVNARSVKEFGARCDGTSDDSVAIQAAFDYAYNAGGAIALSFPAGNCRVGTPISYRGESFFGISQAQSIITGPAHNDVFVAPDKADSPVRACCFQNAHVHDVKIVVDGMTDGNAQAGWAAKGRGAGQGSVFANTFAGWTGQTIKGAVTAAATTIPLTIATDLTNFHLGYANAGWVKVGTEYISYQGITATGCTNSAPLCLLNALRGQTLAGVISTAAALTDGESITPVNPLAPANVTDWIPAWTVGACAFAFPARDGNHPNAPAFSHGFLDHVTINGTYPSYWSANNSCGIYIQGSMYAGNIDHLYAVGLIYGIVFAPPFTNVDAYIGLTPSSDDMGFSRLEINASIPFVLDLAGATNINDITLYAGGSPRQQGVGLTMYSVPCHVPANCWSYLGGSEMGSVNISGVYQEINNGAGVVQAYPPSAQIAGTKHIITGNALSSFAPSSFYPLVWDASLSKMDVAIGTGYPAIQINGSANRMDLDNITGGNVQNLGMGNRITSTNTQYGQRPLNSEATRTPANKLTSEFLALGAITGDWFQSLDDLFFTPEDINNIGPIATVGTSVVLDATVPVTGKYIPIASPGVVTQVGYDGNTNRITGTAFPKGKGTFYVALKAGANGSTDYWQLVCDGVGAFSSATLAPTTTWAVYSVPYDATACPLGGSGGKVQAAALSPATSLQLGWWAFVPQTDTLNAGTINASTVNAVALTATGSITGSTVTANSITTPIVASSSYATTTHESISTTITDTISIWSGCTTGVWTYPPFQSAGKFIIDSEIIGYTYSTCAGSSEVTFKGITRGMYGTSITSHANGSTLSTLPYTVTVNGALAQLCTSSSCNFANQVALTVPTGTAPLAVTSTTPVANLTLGGAAQITGLSATITALTPPLSANVLASNGSSSPIAGTTHNMSVPANCSAASASGTTYTCATVPTFTPVAGDHIQFKVDVANTASATLAVNGATAATFKKFGGSGNLVANDLLAGHWVSATYDGTNWQLEGQLGNAYATIASPTFTGTVAAPTINATSALQVGGVSVRPILSGTTGSLGGSLLAAGACASGTVSVTSSTTAMAVEASPVTYPGDGIYWRGYVSAAGTVTVKVCAAVAATPTASTYNVRVIQ